MTPAMTGQTTMRSPLIAGIDAQTTRAFTFRLEILCGVPRLANADPGVLLSPRPNGAMILPRIPMEVLVTAPLLPQFPKRSWQAAQTAASMITRRFACRYWL